MKYRPEIDGLRAIAVVGVILFHAGLSPLGGGYLGVDVFFVISGYLITTLLLEELQTGRFSLIGFYERRARRIMPPLLVVLGSSATVAWLTLSPNDLLGFSRSLIATCLFISNRHFSRDSGYFEPSADLKPLLHTWSLAVEEQFYLFFPILLLVGWRFLERKVVWVIAALMLASFALAESRAASEPARQFFSFIGRSWELASGALAAFQSRTVLPPPSLKEELAGLTGLGLILMAIVGLDPNQQFQVVHAIPAVLGSYIFILCAREQALAARLLSWRPIVAVGLVSYSGYLWHQPLFAFLRHTTGMPLSAPVAFASLALCALLAVATWRFVECPFRNRAFVSSKQIFVFAIIGTTMLISIGLAGKKEDLRRWRLSDDQKSVAATALRSPLREKCHIQHDVGVQYMRPEDSCTIPAEGKPEWAVIGNSHGVELAYALGRRLGERGIAVRQFTFSACPPTAGHDLTSPAGCAEWTRDVLAHLGKDPGVKNVVLSYKMFDLKENQPTGSGKVQELPDSENLVWLRYVETAAILQSAGKTVFMVLQAPMLPRKIDYYIERESRFEFVRASKLDSWKISAQPEYSNLSRIPKGLSVIDPAKVFCKNGDCAAIMDGKALFFDDHHMSVAGAELVAAQILGSSKRQAE